MEYINSRYCTVTQKCSVHRSPQNRFLSALFDIKDKILQRNYILVCTFEKLLPCIAKTYWFHTITAKWTFLNTLRLLRDTKIENISQNDQLTAQSQGYSHPRATPRFVDDCKTIFKKAQISGCFFNSMSHTEQKNKEITQKSCWLFLHGKREIKQSGIRQNSEMKHLLSIEKHMDKWVKWLHVQ